MNIEQLKRGSHALVHVCADLKPGEKALIVSDTDTAPLGKFLEDAARAVTDLVTHKTIAPFKMHGEEPPAEIASMMLESDSIFGITRYSMAHSRARFNANNRGVRYLSLPDYSEAVLGGDALQADFRGITRISQAIADLFTKGSKVRMRTASGTDLVCRIDGRTGNPAPGWCYGPGTLASPPDAESNVAPLETESNGIVIVDGSIPCRDLGLLKAPIELVIKDGRVREIRGGEAQTLHEIFERTGTELSRVVAEFGIGLNAKAVLCGAMLEDEGCLGTAHIGIGSNATIGGTNSVPFHLDHILRSVSIEVDDTPVMENGRIVLEGFHEFN